MMTRANAQQNGQQVTMLRPRTDTLEIACEVRGPEAGPAVILIGPHWVVQV
jgi:hypothetical protein